MPGYGEVTFRDCSSRLPLRRCAAAPTLEATIVETLSSERCLVAPLHRQCRKDDKEADAREPESYARTEALHRPLAGDERRCSKMRARVHDEDLARDEVGTLYEPDRRLRHLFRRAGAVKRG